jgi:hypothetical protein
MLPRDNQKICHTFLANLNNNNIAQSGVLCYNFNYKGKQ